MKIQQDNGKIEGIFRKFPLFSAIAWSNPSEYLSNCLPSQSVKIGTAYLHI